MMYELVYSIYSLQLCLMNQLAVTKLQHGRDEHYSVHTVCLCIQPCYYS